MNAPIYVTPPSVHASQIPGAATETADLLRQLIDLQKQQLDLFRAQLQNADERTKWSQFFGRWSQDFAELPGVCKKVLPMIERAYLTMLQELGERVVDPDADPLTNEYAISEFLDRYGVRLGQLGSILAPLGHLSLLAPPESPK